MKTWLVERWEDPAKFAATVRGIGVGVGQVVLLAAPYIAGWLGIPHEWVQGFGVVLTGGAAGIKAGDVNRYDPVPAAKQGG